jgi:hypothetical protein
MALTQVRTALTFATGTNPLGATAGLSIETASIDVPALTTTGVAVGLSLQVTGTPTSTATQTTDIIEVLVSQDGTTFDTGTATNFNANPYASYTLSYVASQTSAETVTIPLAYPESIKYMKVRITTTNAGASSSHTYAAALLKTTV